MAKCHSVILVEATGFEPTTSWSRTSSLHAKAVSFACAKRYRTAATPLPKKSHCVIFFGSPEITLARLASGSNKKGRQKPSSFGRGDGIRTHDLLVPNQARYHLRYASIQKACCCRPKIFVRFADLFGAGDGRALFSKIADFALKRSSNFATNSALCCLFNAKFPLRVRLPSPMI